MSGNRRVRPRTIEAPSDPSAPASPDPTPTPTKVRAASTQRPPPRPPKPKRALRDLLPSARVSRGLSLFAGAAVVVASSIGVAWGARRYLLSSPRFAIRTVLVEGAERRSAADVAASGGVKVGSNIFALDLDGARARLTGDPWIERATVTRRLPGTVHISVVEREAKSLVAIGQELYLATRDGDLFKKVEPPDPVDLPLVTGVTPEEIARDRGSAVEKIERALDLVDDLERAGIAGRYPVQEAHIEKDGSMVVTIGSAAILLHFGQPPYREKINYAARVLGETQRRKAAPSVIFLDNEANPDRVVVRLR